MPKGLQGGILIGQPKSAVLIRFGRVAGIPCRPKSNLHRRALREDHIASPRQEIRISRPARSIDTHSQSQRPGAGKGTHDYAY